MRVNERNLFVSKNRRIKACSVLLPPVCGVPYECLVNRLVSTCPKIVNGSIPRVIVGNSLGGRCVSTLFSCKNTNPFSGW